MTDNMISYIIKTRRTNPSYKPSVTMKIYPEAIEWLNTKPHWREKLNVLDIILSQNTHIDDDRIYRLWSYAFSPDINGEYIPYRFIKRIRPTIIKTLINISRIKGDGLYHSIIYYFNYGYVEDNIPIIIKDLFTPSIIDCNIKFDRPLSPMQLSNYHQYIDLEFYFNKYHYDKKEILSLIERSYIKYTDMMIESLNDNILGEFEIQAHKARFKRLTSGIMKYQRLTPSALIKIVESCGNNFRLFNFEDYYTNRIISSRLDYRKEIVNQIINSNLI